MGRGFAALFLSPLLTTQLLPQKQEGSFQGDHRTDPSWCLARPPQKLSITYMPNKMIFKE